MMNELGFSVYLEKVYILIVIDWGMNWFFKTNIIIMNLDCLNKFAKYNEKAKLVKYLQGVTRTE